MNKLVSDPLLNSDGQEPALPGNDSFGLSLENVRAGHLGGFTAQSDLAACLLPLVNALDWQGRSRHILEALPHFADTLDLTDFLNVFANLGFKSRSFTTNLKNLDPRLMPCLFLPEKGPAMVILGERPDGLKVFQSETYSHTRLANRNIRGRVYMFQRRDEDERKARTRDQGYVAEVGERFKPMVVQALAVSFISNLLVLATPLFIMTVYDKVIGSGSIDMLMHLLLGVGIALVADAILKNVRARIIAYVGARMDYILGTAIFQRLLFLPPTQTELANIGSQVARLKDFEGIREFFTGPLATVALEAPFAIIFITVMALLAGPVAVVPVAALFGFLFIGWLLIPALRKRVAASSRAESMRQEFLVEALAKRQALKDVGVEDIWDERYREISARAATRSYASNKLSNLGATLANAIIVSAGIGSLGWGVLRVLEGHMTVGALIAVMILVWWILRPMQTAFLTATQIEQVRSSINQINALMRLPPERETDAETPPIKPFEGAVSFSRVSVRYTAESEPALLGVNFDVEPGELVAVVGPNGSGKTTLLKMIAGLYPPLAGAVKIDGTDIRQLDPLEVRFGISYVPQECQLFFGTIAQNLRLVEPTASDQDLRRAAAEAGMLDDINRLPDGFDTRVGDGRADVLPKNIIQKLSLARAYLKDSPIMLFDEPVNGLDFAADRRFIANLEKQRGKKTCFLVTHRPSHLRVVDKIIVLEEGKVLADGPADKVRGQIPANYF
ncbi:MAG: peptidase domain-containing ABC transporter [Magnetovibrionaceae bacterium]